MATCLLCPTPTDIPDPEILAHCQNTHPEVYGGGPDTWPDGRHIVIDTNPDPAEAQPGQPTRPSHIAVADLIRQATIALVQNIDQLNAAIMAGAGSGRTEEDWREQIARELEDHALRAAANLADRELPKDKEGWNAYPGEMQKIKGIYEAVRLVRKQPKIVVNPNA